MKQPFEARPTVSVDGMSYSRAVEDELNTLASGTFNAPPGRRFLDYLESLTLRRALLPDASDAALRHLEGARWLVGVIKARQALGNIHKELP
jgi:hypothetical protein